MRKIDASGVMISRAARPHGIALTCFLCLALAGCGDEAPRSGERRHVSADSIGAHHAKWLELSSPISPAQWLASRGEEKVRDHSDPEVQRVAMQLVEAHKRYRESERMIANRSVQVSEMLIQIGMNESPVRILDDLTSIGAEVGQTEGFGAVSQYYFNLRAASVSRAEAIATLQTRYGSKS